MGDLFVLWNLPFTLKKLTLSSFRLPWSWKVAAPYWCSPEDKVQARLRLLTVFLLTLGTTGISVGFNVLGRDFYNALATKDQEEFTEQLLDYLAGFAGGIPFFVHATSRTRLFYKIQSQSIIDNPDQRIVDDLNSFTSTAL